MNFETLPPLLAEALTARGYAAPTPVQAAVLEPDAEGRDLLVSAQTGSGKTVAFGLAMAPQLLGEDGRTDRPGAPLALVIAPTRELALQVSRELIWLYGKTGARIATCVGGMDASKERKALNQGAHIVVGTPGRLRDHLERGALQLGSIKVAILDEADEMLDMGFRDDLEQILDATPEARRTFMFSATLPKPIVALAKRYQKDALRVSTVGEDRGHGDIAYQAVTVAPADIENAVVNLLRFHEAPTAMLFCATRDNVRHLHASLIERGFDAVALSGEHSQSERNQALQALARPPRPHLRRHRRRLARYRSAQSVAGHPCRAAARCRDPAAPFRPYRAGRQKGHRHPCGALSARRRVDAMLRGARINAEWVNVPGPEDIRRNDRERLLTALMAVPVEIDDEDRELATRLLAERSPEDIAAALVAMHRSKMPGVEELLDNSGPPQRGDRPSNDGPRPGFEDTVWFKMDVGRGQNADPRWLLPLICRRGHVTKSEIGAIRILPNETRFEIPRGLAPRFQEALRRTEGEDRSPEGGIRIIPAEGPPPPQGRGPRPGGPPHGKPNRPVLVRPLGPNDGRGPPRGPGGPRPNRPPPVRGKLRTP